MSTTETIVAIFTEYCMNNCDVPVKYDHTGSTTEKLLQQWVYTSITDIYNGASLFYTRFFGNYWTDIMTLRYNTNKQFNITTIEFMGITSVGTSKTFANEYSGYIGLAPFESDPDHRDKNFLVQLKKAGLIDYMSFSIYTRNAPDAHSTIKFGGYDDDGLEKNS